MGNQPRIYCPTCGKAARRVYLQVSSATKANHTWRPVPKWAYCPKDKACFAVE